jgi:homocitrate synthase
MDAVSPWMLLRAFSLERAPLLTRVPHSAIEVIQFVKSKNIEIRFSSEDSFRSELVDLLSIYRTVDKIGVNRVGVADTVGCADPRQVYDLVRTLRGVVSCDIETHFHNDTGCGEWFPGRKGRICSWE